MVPKSWHDYRGWLYEIVMNEWPNWWMTLWLFYGSEGHLVRVSLFYIIVWEYTHLLLILSRAHLFIFKICAFFHSKEKKNAHVYSFSIEWHLRIVLLSLSIVESLYKSFLYPPLLGYIFLCILSERRMSLS